MADSDDRLLHIGERIAMLRLGREGALGQLQAEIMRERALSYARAVDKVDRAWLAMRKAEHALEAGGGDRAALLAAFDAAREATLEARWELDVQREASGFVSQSTLEEEYPVPPRRR